MENADLKTRRDFLCETAVVAVALALPGSSPAAPTKWTLKVNDAEITTFLEPRLTLLEALRDFVDVTETKYGCSDGSCGACTVKLGGRPVRACAILAVEAEGKVIETSTPLRDGGLLDPVPAALVVHDALGVGFAAPGVALALRAALDSNPKAGAAELEKALAGNVTTFDEALRRAISALVAGRKKE